MHMALTLESAAAAGGEDDYSYSQSSGGGSKRELMFEKVVTPSDVGKLNRLVVPKHFAERHLPLRGAAARSRGTVLCFHDARGGGGGGGPPAAWRFRYSFWSSSQSYVMTKGWSRYVRDKRLAAGDTVTFCRDGARFFIDCHRRRRTARTTVEQGATVPAAMLTAVVAPTALLGHRQQHQQAAAAVAVAAAEEEEEEARRQHGRCLRLFGVNLLELRAEPMLLDLQL